MIKLRKIIAVAVLAGLAGVLGVRGYNRVMAAGNEMNQGRLFHDLSPGKTVSFVVRGAKDFHLVSYAVLDKGAPQKTTYALDVAFLAPDGQVRAKQTASLSIDGGSGITTLPDGTQLRAAGRLTADDTVHAELGRLVGPLAGRLVLCPPLDYPALLWCLRRSVLALTDSGGIQEEGAALSTPVLVLRNTTERPELIDAGAGMLVGTDEAHITGSVSRLLADEQALARMRSAVNPFGDGHTSARVADLLQRDLGV